MPEFCDACSEREGRPIHAEVLFTDSRTGRIYCHDDILSLITWEMDGCPNADDPHLDLREWVPAKDIHRVPWITAPAPG